MKPFSMVFKHPKLVILILILKIFTLSLVQRDINFHISNAHLYAFICRGGSLSLFSRACR